jgi:hypothetical protein
MGNAALDSEALYLIPHPYAPGDAVEVVYARVKQTRGGLDLTYVIDGPTKRLVVPAEAKPYRTDGLWQTTCLELFVRWSDEQYLEFNFSPSTRWAAYRFSSYRDEMEPLRLGTPPTINVSDEGHALIVSVLLDLPLQPPVNLGLSAVVEERDGTKSYWALRHPPGDKPDFHHLDCFALELPPPPHS